MKDGNNTAGLGLGTIAIHAGQHPDPTTGAIMTPVYQTSTYVQPELGRHLGYEYARTHNPTREAYERNVAALENGTQGIAFSSPADDTFVRVARQRTYVQQRACRAERLLPSAGAG